VTESDDCIFCRIVAGEIPATIVARNDRVTAFRDLNPQASTHVLLVPTRHIAHAGEIGPGDADDVAALFVIARQVAEADGIAEGGYRLVFNVGEDSGNSVAHLHLHLLGGRRMGWPPWAGADPVGH
jgi:histidine triad (HIT) family protein